MAYSKDFIQQMKEKLLAEKKNIEEQLADYITTDENGSVVDFPQYGDHMGENATEVATYDNDLSVQATLKKSLRDIQQSLKTIDEGGYGVCKYCHKDIGEGRLNVRPASSSCVDCKSKFSA